jgi:hypothetical protein
MLLQRREQRVGAGACERRPAGEHLEQHGANRVKIRSAVERRVRHLLWCHVMRRADDHAGVGDRARRSIAGQCRRQHRPSEPEIEQLRAMWREKHV